MTRTTIIMGDDRRRKWPRAARAQILAAAFAPGAVVAKVARQFEVASSLIYTWRREAADVVTRKPVGFSPTILIEPAKVSATATSPLLPPSAAPDNGLPAEPVAITVEFSAGVRGHRRDGAGSCMCCGGARLSKLGEAITESLGSIPRT